MWQLFLACRTTTSTTSETGDTPTVPPTTSETGTPPTVFDLVAASGEQLGPDVWLDLEVTPAVDGSAPVVAAFGMLEVMRDVPITAGTARVAMPLPDACAEVPAGITYVTVTVGAGITELAVGLGGDVVTVEPLRLTGGYHVWCGATTTFEVVTPGVYDLRGTGVMTLPSGGLATVSPSKVQFLAAGEVLWESDGSLQALWVRAEP